jgi:hypothetical protein
MDQCSQSFTSRDKSSEYLASFNTFDSIKKAKNFIFINRLKLTGIKNKEYYMKKIYIEFLGSFLARNCFRTGYKCNNELCDTLIVYHTRS